MRRLLLVLALVGCSSMQPKIDVSDLVAKITTVPGSYPAPSLPLNLVTNYVALIQCVGYVPPLPLDQIKWRWIDSSEFNFLGETHLSGWSNLLLHTITLGKPYKDNPVLIKHELAHSLY